MEDAGDDRGLLKIFERQNLFAAAAAGTDGGGGGGAAAAAAAGGNGGGGSRFSSSHDAGVDASVSTLTGSLRECAACGLIERRHCEWKACGKCKQAHYCSRECQAADWTAHRAACGAAASGAAAGGA